MDQRPHLPRSRSRLRVTHLFLYNSFSLQTFLAPLGDFINTRYKQNKYSFLHTYNSLLKQLSLVLPWSSGCFSVTLITYMYAARSQGAVFTRAWLHIYHSLGKFQCKKFFRCAKMKHLKYFLQQIIKATKNLRPKNNLYIRSANVPSAKIAIQKVSPCVVRKSEKQGVQYESCWFRLILSQGMACQIPRVICCCLFHHKRLL